MICALSFSPDGQLLATGGVGWEPRIWDTSNGKLLSKQFSIYEICSITFNPDDTQLATLTVDPINPEHGRAQIRNSIMGIIEIELKTADDPLIALAYNTEGTMIVSASKSGNIIFWDAKSGEIIRVLKKGITNVFSIQYSPDGKYFATGGTDGIERLFDAESGEEFMAISGLPSQYNVAFNSTGTLLTVVSPDRSLRDYFLDVDELLALARSRVTRSLTEAECQMYLHVEQCP